jgi:hypothetical protein
MTTRYITRHAVKERGDFFNLHFASIKPGSSRRFIFGT